MPFPFEFVDGLWVRSLLEDYRGKVGATAESHLRSPDKRDQMRRNRGSGSVSRVLSLRKTGEGDHSSGPDIAAGI